MIQNPPPRMNCHHENVTLQGSAKNTAVEFTQEHNLRAIEMKSVASDRASIPKVS